MQHSPIVSILMTAYNREKYIAEAIESVLASTFKDFELIVLDDCSKDKTVEIARAYEQQDNRVRVYINEKNLGDYPNRNRAASYAKGKYIKYVDADDAIYPWGLQIVVNCMERFSNAAYGLDSIEQDNERLFPFVLKPEEAYYREYFKASLFHKSPTSCIIKKRIFDEVGGFPEAPLTSDQEFWHCLSLTNDVVLMPHGIVWSRIHDQQESRATRESSLVVYKYSMVPRRYLSDDRCPLKEKDRKLALNRVIRSQARSVMRSLLIERNMKFVQEKLQLGGFSLISAIFISLKKY